MRSKGSLHLLLFVIVFVVAACKRNNKEGYFYVEGNDYYYQQPLNEYQRKLYKSRDELVNALNKASCVLRIPFDNDMLEQIENDILKRNKGIDYPDWNWNTEFGNKCIPFEPPCECNNVALLEKGKNMAVGFGRQNPIGIEAVNYPAGSNSWIPVCHTGNSYARAPVTVHLIVNPQAYACVSGFEKCMTRYHNVVTHEENWCLPPENKKPDNCGNGYIEKWECGRVRGKCGPNTIRVDMWTQLRKFAMKNRSVFDDVEDYRISPFTISDNSHGGCGEFVEGKGNSHLAGDTGYKFMSTCYSRVKPIKMCHSISDSYNERWCEKLMVNKNDCDDSTINEKCPGICGKSKKECDKFSGFTCGDGHCILSSYKCDQYEDCKDGSDEFDCSTENLL